MLSDSERRYLKGELKPPPDYRMQLDLRIRIKVEKALEDLTLIAEEHNFKQWNKIFNIQKSDVIPFIHALLLNPHALRPPRKRFREKKASIHADQSQQWYLAWVIYELAIKRILRKPFLDMNSSEVSEVLETFDLHDKMRKLLSEYDPPTLPQTFTLELQVLFKRLKEKRLEWHKKRDSTP